MLAGGGRCGYSTLLAQDPSALKRFEREAKAVAALSHPNILEIHDFGADQDVSYAVMELLEGETLRARIKPRSQSIRTLTELRPVVESVERSKYRISHQERNLDRTQQTGRFHPGCCGSRGRESDAILRVASVPART